MSLRNELENQVTANLYTDGESANAATLNRPLIKLKDNDLKLYDLFSNAIVNSYFYLFGAFARLKPVVLEVPYSFSIGENTITFTGEFKLFFQGQFYKVAQSCSFSSLTNGKRYYIFVELPAPYDTSFDFSAWLNWVENRLSKQNENDVFVTVNWRIVDDNFLYSYQDEQGQRGFALAYFDYKNNVTNYSFNDNPGMERAYLLRHVLDDIGVIEKNFIDFVANFETRFFERLAYVFDTLKGVFSALFVPGVLPRGGQRAFALSKDNNGFLQVGPGFAILGDGQAVCILNSINTGLEVTGNYEIYLDAENYKPVIKTTGTYRSIKLGSVTNGNINQAPLPNLKLRVPAGIVFEGLHNPDEPPKSGELRYSNGWLAYATKDNDPSSMNVISTINAGANNVITFGFESDSGVTNEEIVLKAGGSSWVALPPGYIFYAVSYISGTIAGESSQDYNEYSNLNIVLNRTSLVGVSFLIATNNGQFKINIKDASGVVESIVLNKIDGITRVTEISFTIYVSLNYSLEFR